VPVATTALARVAQARSLEELARGARRRQHKIGPAPREVGQDLAWTPVRVSPFGLQEGRLYRLCHAMGAVVRGTALFLQPRQSLLRIAAHPFVAGIAANAEALT